MMAKMMITVNAPMTLSSVETYFRRSPGGLFTAVWVVFRNDATEAVTVPEADNEPAAAAATGRDEAGLELNFLCLDFDMDYPFYFALGCAFS
jgi:hypothetical protein